MSDVHPLYSMILNHLTALDKRDIMPDRPLRLRELSNYLTNDLEKDTELFTVNPERTGDIGR